jgi:hypothetical protein
MQTIVLNPFYHKGHECISILFTANPLLNGLVKKLPGAKWSQTFNCWYIDCNKDGYNHLVNSFTGKADIDVHLLRKYLVQQRY